MGRKKDDDRKVYVLDTSALVHDPLIVNRLGDNIIIIPISTVSELDGLKKREGNIGYNVREAISTIEELTNNGLNPATIKQGVRTKSGGKLLFDFVRGEDWETIPDGIEHNNDARVLLAAKKAMRTYSGHKVVVLSQDINLRVIVRSCGVYAEGYRNDQMVNDVDEMYSGRNKVEIPNSALVLKLIREGSLPVAEIEQYLPRPKLFPNECLEVASNERFALAIHQNGQIRYIPPPDKEPIEKGSLQVVLKNNEQKLGYALATDPVIELNTFSGKTGSGKSFLALLGAFILTRYDDSKRIMVFRPHIELGPEFGILPGGVNEKFAPWMRPVVEIMRKIVRAYNKDFSIDAARRHVDEMITAGHLEINPISHIRGCTFDDAVIIIDEGQNLTPHEMRSTVTRAGEGSRIFITGDPTQVDNRFLDSRNNGLVFLTERFKGDLNFGHLTFYRSVRSALAEKAAQLLA